MTCDFHYSTDGMKNNILLLTAYDSRFANIAKLTVPVMKQYAERHRCLFREVVTRDIGRMASWNKIPLIQQALDEGFELVCWLDADVLFVRHDLDIRSSLSPSSDLHMCWLGPETTQWYGPPGLPGHYNAGVFVIRNTEWAKRFLERVWNGEVAHEWAEQAAMLHLLGYDNLLNLGPEQPDAPDRAHVANLDPIWNSVPGVAMTADPMVHHYAGIEYGLRLRLMEADCNSLLLSAGPPARQARATRINGEVKRAREGK